MSLQNICAKRLTELLPEECIDQLFKAYSSPEYRLSKFLENIELSEEGKASVLASYNELKIEIHPAFYLWSFVLKLYDANRFPKKPIPDYESDTDVEGALRIIGLPTDGPNRDVLEMNLFDAIDTIIGRVGVSVIHSNHYREFVDSLSILSNVVETAGP